MILFIITPTISQIPLASLANVQARWTAVRGPGVKGDIAIDDVSYENCGVKTCDVPPAVQPSCGTTGTC